MENLMMYGDMQHQLGNNIMQQQQQHLPQLQQQQQLNQQQQMAQQHHMSQQQQMSPASSASGYSPVQEQKFMNSISSYLDFLIYSYIWTIELCSDVVPHWLYADPDPQNLINADPDRGQLNLHPIF